VQSEWRVACVRIPRFPIAAVWRSARRGDLGATGAQLLLPFQASDLPSTRREQPIPAHTRSLPSDSSRASAGAPSRTTAPETGHAARGEPPAPAPDHWDELPIVLTEGVGNRRRLRAVSAAAGRCGIRAGMSIAEAQAKCAELQELPWDDVAIAGAITEATAMLVEASPQVTPVRGAPGMWWVGASGFGPRERARQSERELAHRLRRIGARWHPRARVAIADSCVAARAATWAGVSFREGGDERSLVCVVPAGHDAAYLATAPLALVPMDDELREGLQALGLRSLGAFATLAPGDVERRWGDAGLAAWRLARGEDRRRPVLARIPTRPTVEAELGTPSATMEPVLFLVRAALERLTAQLTGEGRAIASLAITLTLDDARGALPDARPHTVTREVRPARPVARVAPLFEHCRALLDKWTLTAPVAAVAVAVVSSAPLSGEQGDLLSTQWRDPAAVDAALARLRAELGPNVVVKPYARDSHRPERAGGWSETTVSAAAGDARPRGTPRSTPQRPPTPPSLTISSGAHAGGRQVRERALHAVGPAAAASSPPPTAEATTRLLEQPEPATVLCDGEVPRVVTWRGVRITVDRAVGPERLSGEWWDDGYRRDYWRCESAEGDFVIYLDRASEEWWMQGWHD
jgi:protein ImuB